MLNEFVILNLNEDVIFYEFSGKNNQKSKEIRNKGNQKFKNGDFLAAMKLYNEALCLAESGIDHLYILMLDIINFVLKTLIWP